MSCASAGERVDSPGRTSGSRPVRLARWLLEHRVQPVGPEADEGHAKPHAWWKVMCLTGVDYFSTLAYLPGIAALAAGALSPLATLLIVALTLLGHAADVPAGGQGEPARAGLGGDAGGPAAVLAGQAVRAGPARLRRHLLDHHDHPVRRRRLRAPAGEPVLPRTSCTGTRWPSRSCCCWSSAGCSCSASARRSASRSRWSRCSWRSTRSSSSSGWSRCSPPRGALSALDRRAHRPAAAGSAGVIGPAVLAFPLLVLGLSGFETGVSMMPLVAADGADAEQRLRSRIRNTRKLLTAAALIMSCT